MLFARDGDYGPWQRLAYVDGDMQPILATVIERLPSWEVSGDEGRFAYFASLLGHPSNRVHDLALRELDLADYGLLRDLPKDVNTLRILARLNLPTETNLKPIRVLLLGFSDAPEIAEMLRKGVEIHAASAGPLLGAYATAAVQHGGVEAAHWLIAEHLIRDELSRDSRELIIEALAIHSSTADHATRDAIQAEVSETLRKNPDLAPLVARQFGARSDWSQKDALHDLMRSGAFSSPIDMLLLTQYVSIANDVGAQAGN